LRAGGCLGPDGSSQPLERNHPLDGIQLEFVLRQFAQPDPRRSRGLGQRIGQAAQPALDAQVDEFPLLLDRQLARDEQA